MSAAEVAQLTGQITALSKQVQTLQNLLIEPQYQTAKHDYRTEIQWSFENQIKPELVDLANRLQEVENRLYTPGKQWDNVQDMQNRWLPDILGQTLAIEEKLGVARAPIVQSPIPDIPTAPLPTYTVVAGDTLSGIAAKTGHTVQELQTWNNISDPNSIQVGQVIKLTP